MRILVDTNRIIAALVKRGTSRDILFDEFFELVTPDYTLIEIDKHKEEIRQKTHLEEDEFELLLMLVFEHIIVIPKSDYTQFIDKCKNDMSDPDDVPHLAAALATNAEGIWAHDPHFLEQKKVKVFTNIDMLKIAGKMRRE